MTIKQFHNVNLLGDVKIAISPNGSDVYSPVYLNLHASQMLPAQILPTHNKTCIDHTVLYTLYGIVPHTLSVIL